MNAAHLQQEIERIELSLSKANEAVAMFTKPEDIVLATDALRYANGLEQNLKSAKQLLKEAIANEAPEPEEDAVTMTADNVDVYAPPGIAGDICRLMEATARRSRPEIYPLAALQLLALVGRGRESDYTSKLNLITLSIASSASGKETPQDVVKRIANDLDLSRYIIGDMGSFKDMISNLIEGRGNTMYIMDEVHSMLSSIKSKNAASYETKIEAEILKMTTTGLYTFRGAEKRTWSDYFDKKIIFFQEKLDAANDESPEGLEEALKLTRQVEASQRYRGYIDNGWPDPFVSIMGHSVPERMDEFAADLENIASGFLGRSILARAPIGAGRLKLTLDVREANILKADIVHRLDRIKYSTAHIECADDARDFMTERSNYYEQESVRNDDIMGAIYRRSTEQIFKVATILAIETGCITLEHARYAAALVEASNSDIRYIILQSIAARDSAGDAEVLGAARLSILKTAKPTAGATVRELGRSVTRTVKWKGMQDKDVTRDMFAELIAKMLDAGELEEVGTGRVKKYRSLSVIS